MRSEVAYGGDARSYVRGTALNIFPNCKWFSHNTCVNEPEPSIGASSGSQVGNLLVCLSGEAAELVLIFMNNGAVTCARLLRSPQRLVQVTDCTARASPRICVCEGSRLKMETPALPQCDIYG